MSAKDQYSTNVEIAKQQAIASAKAAIDWEKGRREKERYGKNWEAININDYVPEFYDSSLVEIRDRKMFFPTKDRNIVIVADFAGGYLRFINIETGEYVGKNGSPVSAKNRREFESKTHYRILKKEEM